MYRASLVDQKGQDSTALAMGALGKLTGLSPDRGSTSERNGVIRRR